LFVCLFDGNAPAAYVRRLKQGRRIGTDKVRRIRKKCFTGSKSSSPMGSHSADSAGSEQDDCCYGSSDSREGGGEITEQTLLEHFFSDAVNLVHLNEQ
jgi:hypothetical protein